MQKLKRWIAGMTAVLMCVMNVLQPVTLYASAEELTAETAEETETAAQIETGMVVETETVIETVAETLSEPETETTAAETETETETESEEIELEPVKYTVSGTYHGQGRVTFKDSAGHMYEISGPDKETSFEFDEGAELTIQAVPGEGYEIAAATIVDDSGCVWKNDERESLNAAVPYEKNFAVSAATKVMVQFEELPEETEIGTSEDKGTEPETVETKEIIEGSETNSAAESKTTVETEPEGETEETDASQDGILTEDEKAEAVKLAKQMKTAVDMNDSVMTLNLGEVGQSWAMFEVFVNRILVSEFGPNPVTHYSHILQTGADYSEFTHTAYCVQYGVTIPAGSYAMESLLPQSQQDYMGYALAYGWKQNGTAYDESQYESSAARTEYAVTQAIVWACSQGKFNTDAGEAAIQQILQNTYDPAHAQAYYQQLKAQILNAETIPSFSGSGRDNAPTIQLSWSAANGRYETTVTDANGVLDRYNYTCAGIQFEKTGNSLTIWTNNLYTDGAVAEAVYANIGGAGSVITWDGENGTQDLATYAEISNNVYSYIRIVTEGKGALELIKRSANSELTSGNSCYSLAGAVYGVYDAANQEIGRIITNADGRGQLTDIVAGTYTVKELTAPKGFYVDTSAYNVTVTPGQKATVRVEDVPKTDPVAILLGKIDAETNSNKPSGSKSLEGALFEVRFYAVQMDTDPAESGYLPERVWVLKTNSIGYCRLSKDYKVSGDDFYYSMSGSVALPYGTISIQEIQAPEGYLVNDEMFVKQITPGNTVGVSTYNYPTIPETPQKIQIELEKVDAETGEGKAQGSGTLAGAEYEVRDAENRVVDTMVTDTNGHAVSKELPLGIYTVKESKASIGYLIDSKTYTVDASNPKDTTSRVIKYGVKSFETPQKLQIELEKVDSETGEGAAQGAGTLAGAEYEILDLDSKVVDTLVTDAAGHAVSKELPLGVYKVREAAATNGYLVDQDVYTVAGSRPKDGVTSVFKYKASSGEDIIRGDVEIIKFYENIDEDNDTLEGIKDVEFTFTSKTTGKVVKKIVTNKDGFATTASSDQPRGSLVFDTYIVTETKYPAGVKPIEPFEVTISEEGVTLKGIYKEDRLIVSPVAVVKKDKTTGSIIPAANTEFRLLDEYKKSVTMTTHYPETTVYETFKTNGKGQFSFPEKLKYGTYYLEEIQAPDGYLKGGLLEFKVTDGATWENPLVIEYYDEPVMGKIQIEKADAETGDLLNGAEFDLIAAEDIITPDGTIRLKKGDVADHVITEDGVAESKELYLGSYEIRETKQPQGYVLSDEVYSVTLEYKDQATPVVVQSVNVTNSPVKVRIIKVDAESGKVLPGVEFKIWNKAMAEDGIDPGMAADMLYKTDEKGFIELGYLSPGTYCVQETKSIYGYALDDTVHEFTVSEDGRIDGKEVGEIRITNTPVEIGTKALDKVDGDQIITNMEKETLIDTVSYSGLIPGKEYTVNGVLMVKSTGKPLMDDGREVTAELTFIAEKAEGEVELAFTFNASALAGEKIVAFESVLYEGKEIAAHADIEDEDQTVEVVPIKIGTQVKDKVDNDQTISAMPEMTIIDTVEYSRLHVGWNYTIKGILMDKSTGKPLLVDGKEVTTETGFTAEAENGTVDVEFAFDASDFANQELVVFEELYYKDELIAEHKDIDDKGQTVEVVPVEIGTKASDMIDGDKQICADEDVTLIDTVSYKNLVPGRTYTVSGILMDKSTGEPLLVGGKMVTTEKTFTAERPEGEIELSFTFDASALAGKTIVVFEKLLYEGREIAAHEDIEDAGQSVEVVPPEIKTTATNKADGSKEVKAEGRVAILDTVSYSGLVPGREYTVSGILMDKSTGKPLTVDGKEVAGRMAFTAEAADGTVAVEFTFDAAGLGDMELVVFEKLFNAGGKAIAAHEDLSDEGQTVRLKKAIVPDVPKTGDAAHPYGAFGLCLMSAGLLCFLGQKKKREK